MSAPALCDILLDEEERRVLLSLLEGSLGETRVEVHRTHTPSYRREVIHQEEVVRRLIAKVRAQSIG